MRFALTRRHLLQLSALAAAGVPSLARGAGLTMAALEATGTVRLGCSAATPPFTFRDAKGDIVGYDVDVARLIWEGRGIKVVFVDTDWAGVITALYSKKFDLVMCSMSYTRQRMKWLAFSIPYVETSQVLLIRAGDAGAIRQVADLHGRTIAVQLGSAGEDLAHHLAEQKQLTYRQMRPFTEHRDSVQALEQSQVDAVFCSAAMASVDLAASPGRLAMVRSIGAENWAGVAARPEDAGLVRFIDQRIGELRGDGQLAALQEKWFGFRMHLADAVPRF